MGVGAALFSRFRLAVLTSVVSFTFDTFGFVADAQGILNGVVFDLVGVVELVLG